MRFLLCVALMVGIGSQESTVAANGVAKTRDGVDIRYELVGSGSPTLVFIHGWNCDRSYWSGQNDHWR
jgi:hypothetical protein